MATSFSTTVRGLVLLLHLSSVLCQQFSTSGIDVDGYNVTSACRSALNGTITCDDSFLAVIAESGDYLEDSTLTSLCTGTCLTSLQDFQSSLKGACSDSDVVGGGSLQYPAYMLGEYFLYNYATSCRKDAASGGFCSSLFLDWLNETSLTPEQQCSDCLVGMVQIELNSSFGYMEEIAADFAATTSSCGLTNYPYTSPSTALLEATMPSTTTDAPTPTDCADTYTVVDGDTCTSISLAQNVSTFSLLYQNGLQAYCSNFPEAGASLCLPSQCAVYTVSEDDTCAGIIEAVPGDITLTQLMAWNPNINAPCSNLHQLVDTQICVGPGGDFSIPTATAVPTSAVTTAAPAPTDVANGTNTYCAQYYLVQKGDTCASLSLKYSLSLSDFYFLNQGIDENCHNLIADQSYCVRAVGNINTYVSYNGATGTNDPCLSTSAPASCWADLPTATYWSSNATFTPTTTRAATAAPLASGTRTDCYQYSENRNVTSWETDSLNSTQLEELKALQDQVNTCSNFADSYGVDIGTLLAWNPSLADQSEADCRLLGGVRYCVRLFKTTTTTPSYTQPVVSTPQPYAPASSVAANCNSYALVYGGDVGYPCSSWLYENGISLEDLTLYNPWINNNCSAIYDNLAADEWRSLCIGVGDSAPSTTAPPTAIPTDTTPGCTEYYTVVDGDSCATVLDSSGITFAQLYAWNPSVGDDCQYLQPGVAYCVAAPSSPTTSAPPTSTTGAGAVPPGPTQDGIAANCTKYVMQQDGVFCYDMAAAAGITLDDLYTWNPALGGDCSGLWPGYAYCVGVS